MSGASDTATAGFSPVAGIQWVETLPLLVPILGLRFSPVAGIQWVETKIDRLEREAYELLFQSRCRDSVG